MGTAELALVVSFVSLGVSGYNAFRDSTRLKLDVWHLGENEYGPAKIKLRVANVGRRPVVIRLVGGVDVEGRFSGTYIDHEKGGRRLGEGESYEQNFDKDDLVDLDPLEGTFVIDRLGVQDAVGNQYIIKKSKSLVAKMLA
jgi:hypothetical protein